jgi:hypothetical protein
MRNGFVRGVLVAFVLGGGTAAFAASVPPPTREGDESRTKCVAECVAKAAECVKKHAGHKIKEAECAEAGVKCEKECK